MMPDLDKSKITIGVAASIFVFLLLQTVIATWWASGINANMVFVRETLSAAVLDKYTSTEARRDLESRDAKIKDLKDQQQVMQSLLETGKASRISSEMQQSMQITNLTTELERIRTDVERNKEKLSIPK